MAAFKAAEAFSMPISGYVPKDYTNETGPYDIPSRFRQFVKETSSTASAERTRLNIQDADGILTLLQAESDRSEVSEGTQLGLDHARELGKPVEQLCFVDLKNMNADDEIERVTQWIKVNGIEKCLIGGPRESEVPGIEEAAHAFLMGLFDKLTAAQVSG